MYLVLIVLPLLGSIVSGFFGRKVGVSGAQLITSSSIFVTTILSLFAFYEVGLNNVPVSIELFRWVDSESFNVLWAFQFDSLTVSMLIPVLIVSCLVHIYSIGYMSHDPHNQRFFSYLSLFTFMMIILVTANNFLLMFVGWEGVGICSYLLVSFWFTRIAANQSSMSAFLTNRVGDCFLTIGMFAILWSFGNIDYSTVFSLAPFVSENSITIIGICLLIGAMAKSSQIGLHVWLPLAMEGPTPVSALIHAATMVTAGVYLLMRTSPLIEYSTIVLLLCLWIGALTTVFSSLIGLFQQDIKKVIAYSTMSQLARGFLSINQTMCENALEIIQYIIIYLIKIQRLSIYSLFCLFIKVYFFRLTRRPLSTQCLNSSACYFAEQCNEKLYPWYLTGFVDGVGSFLINVKARSDLKLAYNVYLVFKLKIHSRDKILLESIRNYLDNIGKITIRKDGYIEFIVSSIKDIKVLINHFDTYSFITQKWADYQIFKQTFILINNKEHLTIQGLKKVLSLKSVFNNGLYDLLKAAFPKILPAIRPQTPLPQIKNPDGISEFVDAEGCFFVRLSSTSTSTSLVFKIAQDIRDANLLEELSKYFNCGYYKLSYKLAGEFLVTKFDNINKLIIHFFKKYPILGSKFLNFDDFVKAAELIQNKALISKGWIEQVKQIKSGKNKGRGAYEYSSMSFLSNKFYKKIAQLPSVQTDKKHYSSFATRQKYSSDVLPNSYTLGVRNEKSFNEWLGGLIDGIGEFLVSKKGYANFKIVLPEEDKCILYEIKHKFGGSIKSISGSNSFKYKLHHKKGLIKLVHSINGLIRKPAKLLQLNKVCVLYNIYCKSSIPLTYNNGWLSGIIDANGSITLNEQCDQLILSCTEKNKLLLDPLNKLFMARVKILSSKDAFEYSIFRKNEILDLLDNYFSKYPLRSNKARKLKIIKDFYLYKEELNQPDKLNKWINFKNKWDKL